MSTVSLRAPYMLHVSVLRVAAVIVAVPDVFTEAQDIASAAQNRIRSPNGERQNFRNHPSKGGDERQV